MDKQSSFAYPATLWGCLVGVIASAPTGEPAVTIPTFIGIGILIDLGRSWSRRRAARPGRTDQ